jgi:hypothetical protein
MTLSSAQSLTCRSGLVWFVTQVSHSYGSPRLLDPSCSGSGIVNRLDHLLEAGTGLIPIVPSCGPHISDSLETEDDASQEDRLDKLAAFQLMMIKHAMRCKLVFKKNFFLFPPFANSNHMGLHLFHCEPLSSERQENRLLNVQHTCYGKRTCCPQCSEF